MSEAIIKKNGTDYKLPMLAEHYPADRVYLDGDTSKTVQDALKWKELLSTPLTTSASNYTLSESVAKYNELMLAGCWNGGANTVWVIVPVINGSVSLEHTILHLNNDSSGTAYNTIESISGNTINAYGASTSCWLRVYAR